MDLTIVKTTADSKKSVDRENITSVSLESTQTTLSSDSVSETVDQYTQYLKEKDDSNKYRMIFTISPVCSNVLFNQVTEIVVDEGNPQNAIFFAYDGPSTDITSTNQPKIFNYCQYKGETKQTLSGITIDTPTVVFNRSSMIKDTGYSHPDTGGVVYHCGYDIFDNHTLRRKEFGIINKLGTRLGKEERKNFNTIADYSRNSNGEINQFIPPLISTKTVDDKEVRYIATGETRNQHEYLYDTLMSFPQSIRENLTEEDGWLGFLNPCTMKVPNYVMEAFKYNTSLNKCMNNNKAGEFIDMYPDRSLFSFLPKYNKHLNRYEYNWDYCITYPYKNYYDNHLFQETYSKNGMKVNNVNTASITINGIRANTFNDDVENTPNTLFEKNSDGTYSAKYSESDTFTLRTDIKHVFSGRYSVKVWMIFELDDIIRIFETSQINVVNTGVNGTDNEYYITLNYSDFAYFTDLLIAENATWGKDLLQAKVQFRITKIVDGVPCKYYFRIFKKIPNFARTNVYNDNYISENEIEANIDNKYNTNIQKMAFERTIYNENKVQIIYNDDIDLSCLQDNLGRKLTDVYLTIIKKNTGYKHWYGSNINPRWNPDTENVEFSHCFGKVTAGIDVPSYVGNYNIHKLHNISSNCIEKMEQCSYSIPQSAKCLEESSGDDKTAEITPEGDTFLMTDNGTKHKYEFFGDIVELMPTRLEETVLEDVFFRFNTQQREYEKFTVNKVSSALTSVDGEFANISYHDITSDDYDTVSGFTVTRKMYNSINECDINGNKTKETRFPVNICPEGYYYKAHYRIPVRKLSSTVYSGSHTKIFIDGDPIIMPTMNGRIIFKTKENYYLDQTSKLILYKKDETHERKEATIVQVSGDDFNVVDIRLIDADPQDFKNYDVFKANPLMPDNAYEYTDGTGRYIWRDVENEINLTTDDELYNSMFTNGAHYKHENITFMLHRQDPYGENGLLVSSRMGGYSRIANLNIEGKYHDMSNKEYIPEEEGVTC